MTAHHFEDIPNFLDLLVQIFSIIGGLFMIAKVLDNYISCLWTPEKQNQEISAIEFSQVTQDEDDLDG